MDILTDQEIRVLGALLEKEMATPEYYPLTLNSLVAACNQKTNREPVVAYDEETILTALAGLREKKMVRQSSIGRAMKYEQIFTDARKLIAREKAALCILLLRGPQTIGEIRGRSDRLHCFADLDEVRQTLESLQEMVLVTELPRQPGRKEARFCQLLAGTPVAERAEDDSDSGRPDRREGPGQRADLQGQIDTLRQELKDLREEFVTLRDLLS
jgi:uncharacterized protein